MCEEEEADPTPILIPPPRPPNPQDTPTAQAPTFHKERPQTSADVPALNQPHAGKSTIPDENAEKLEAGEEGKGVEGDALVEGKERIEEEEKRKGEEPVGSEEYDTVNTGEGSELEEGVDVGHVGRSRESGQGDVEAIGVGNLEGETPAGEVEGETPVGDLEGETPAREVEGETPVGNLEGETPSENVEGEASAGEVEGETPVGNLEGEIAGEVDEGKVP